jgi:hypothetical protein
MNNIKISQLTENTSPSLSGVTVLTEGDNAYKVSLETLKNNIFTGSTAAGTTPIDVTYLELLDLCLNSGLTINSTYRLTDYRNFNFLHGQETADFNNPPNVITSGFTPQEVYTGNTEVLLLNAVTTSEISPIGFSESYPNDIITYNPFITTLGTYIYFRNGRGITGFDLQWDNTNSYAYFDLPSGNTASYGYTSVYAEFQNNSYRIDFEINPYLINNDNISYNNGINVTKVVFENNNNRIILCGITQNDVNLYDVNTLYFEGYTKAHDIHGQIVRRQDKFKNIDTPFDFRGIRYRRFEVNTESIPSDINFNLSTDYFSIGEQFIDVFRINTSGITGNYKDYPVFPEDSYNIKYNSDRFYYHPSNFVIINSAYNLNIGNDIDYSTFKTMYNVNTRNGIYSTVIYDFYNSNINSNYFGNNICGTISNLNINIDTNFNDNKIVQMYNNNIYFGTFASNQIKEMVRNEIYGHFYNNVIGMGFLDNKVNYLQSSIISDNFEFNDNVNLELATTSTNFVNNTFLKNTSNAPLTGILTGTTHFYQPYNCTISKSNDNNWYLTYLSGGTMTTVSI